METKKILAAMLLLCTALAASAQEEKPSTAIITTKIADIESILYVDFAGGRVASEAVVPDVTTCSYGIFHRYFHQLSITDSVSTVTIDLDAKAGVRYPSLGAIAHPDSLLNQGLRKVGEEEIGGWIYDKYVMDSLQYKKYVAQRAGKDSSSEEVLAQIRYPRVFLHQTIWMWHGLVLRTGNVDQSGQFVISSDDIPDIQVNVPLPAEKFTIPEGTAIRPPAVRWPK
jgi:hypothetical protein